MGKEILTIQLGQKANYVGTHFWNAQEAGFEYDEGDKPVIDNDVNFRAGKGQGGVETYTPRVLIYDLKGGFGSLKKYNALYEGYDNEPDWDGNVQQYRETEVGVHPYQSALETGEEEDVLTTEKVRWWSDFNRVYYHPRSTMQLNQYQFGISPFDSFNQGRDLFRDDEEILDKEVRPFAEECDSLQGFQMILDSHSSWAGFGTEYLDALREEFPKASVWTWGIESPTTNAPQRLSFAQLLSSVHDKTTLYMPLHPAHHIPSCISIDTSSFWHTSALFSLAYDSVTLPTRSRLELPYTMDMYDLTMRVNIHGQRTIAEPSVTVLFDHPESKDRMSFGWHNVPGVKGFTATVLRGTYANDIDDLTKMLDHGDVVTERIIHPQSLLLPTSFPKIFPHHAHTTSISTFASISSNPATVQSRLRRVKEDARILAPLEEREELYNSIAEISEHYGEDEDLEG